MASDREADRPPTPPYVAWSTEKTFLAGFKEHGIPGRVDRTVLGNFSNQVGGQLITANRFLGLIDESNMPTNRMLAVVAAYGTDKWPVILSELLDGAYAPLMRHDLSRMTPGQFNDVFKELYPGEGDTIRKCQTFFLAVVQEAGLPVSPYILKNKKPRAAPVKRRAPKPKAPKKADDDGDKNRPDFSHLRPDPPKSPEQVLLDLLDPVAMAPNEQQAVFTLLLYLKAKGGSAAT